MLGMGVVVEGWDAGIESGQHRWCEKKKNNAMEINLPTMVAITVIAHKRSSSL